MLYMCLWIYAYNACVHAYIYMRGYVCMYSRGVCAAVLYCVYILIYVCAYMIVYVYTYIWCRCVLWIYYIYAFIHLIEVCMCAPNWYINFMLFVDTCYCNLKTGSHVSQAGLKLPKLMVPLPEPWDYRHAPLHLVDMMLAI